MHFASSVESEMFIENLNFIEVNQKVASVAILLDNTRFDGHVDLTKKIHSSILSSLEENSDSTFFKELLDTEGENQIVQDRDLHNVKLQTDN